MIPHVWTQDVHIGAGKLEGLPYVTSLQRHRCRNCDETITLPDCGKATCLILMSFGCTPVPRKKLERIEPTQEEMDQRDQPQRRQGHEAKRRKR